MAQCSVTGTQNGSACYGGSATIRATPSGGSDIRWFDQMTGGTALDTGNIFTVTNVTTPGTYYAEAFDGGIIVDDSINTLTANNGQAAAMFDCEPSTDITVTGFNFTPRSSTNYTASIYYKSGTLVGSETNSNAWTLLGTSSSFSASANVLTRIPVTFSQQLTANQTYAFYIYVSGGSLGYTNGSTLGAVAVSNNHIEIYQGRGAGGLFSSSLFTVRTFAGTMLYEVGSACMSTREPVTITVTDSTEIVNQSSVDTTCTGLPLQLFVETEGEITGYQWQMYDNSSGKFIDINKSPFVPNGDTLNITSTGDTLDGAIIRCTATGKCGSETSENMTIIVNTLPSVVVPPQDVYTTQGANAVFRVQASGAAVQYHWQVGVDDSFAYINDGGIYSGVTTNQLNVRGVSRAQNEFQFRCIINGIGNCAIDPDTSNFASLYVEPLAGVHSTQFNRGITIYPNPVAGGGLAINTQETGILQGTYRISDNTGRTVAQGALNREGITRVNTDAFAPGVYIVEVADNALGKGSTTLRFTKR